MTSTTSVGWDTTLAGGQSTWSTPLDGSSGAAAAVDASGLVEKTKQIKVDANDYSRFKNIGDSDDEAENKAKSDAPAAGGDTCRNCHKPGAKLKCSVCKKAAYCARACQASDWAFHKRICKKPEEKKPEPPRKRPATSSTSSNSSSNASTSSSSTAETTTPPPPTTKSTSTTTAKKSSESTTVVVDEPDLPAAEMRGYKNGLPYFHRELSENEQKLIGDIAPKKVEVVPEAVKPVEHHGSAWNAAGTFEERSFTKWAEQKWRDLYNEATFTEGDYEVTLSPPEKITGDASVCVVRGKKRYLFDFSFKLPFEVKVNGAKYKGSYQMNEISNDEDYEISYKLSKKPTDAAQAAALQKFVATRSSGLQKEVLRIVGEFIRDFQSQ